MINRCLPSDSKEEFKFSETDSNLIRFFSFSSLVFLSVAAASNKSTILLAESAKPPAPVIPPNANISAGKNILPLLFKEIMSMKDHSFCFQVFQLPTAMADPDQVQLVLIYHLSPYHPLHFEVSLTNRKCMISHN